MKLVTFQVDTPMGPLQRLGAVARGRIIDLNMAYCSYLWEDEGGRAYEIATFEIPPSMIRFLETGATGMRKAEEALQFVDDGLDASQEIAGPKGESIVYDLQEVRLLAPLPWPNSIRDFTCFEGHALKLTGPKHKDWYEMPVHYNGNPCSVIGPEEVIPWPAYTEKLDYEMEYGLYISKMGKDIPREKAMDYVAGFTIFNDVSARDVPRGFYLGPSKMKDFCNVMGPYLVTPDEIDPTHLRMTARINGEVWSDGNSQEMYWTWPELIEFASMEETLYPGDFLGSGTIANGCGLDHDRWLQPGDVIELEVEGLGILCNRIGPKPKAMRSLRLRVKA